MLQNQAEEILEESDDVKQTGGILEYFSKVNVLDNQI